MANLSRTDADPTGGGEGDLRSDSLLRILLQTAPFTGDQFFESLTEAILVATGVRSAFVSEFLVDGRARVVTVRRDDQFLHDIEWELEGTPAQVAVEEGLVALERDVLRHFPGARSLKTLSAQAYTCVLLRSSSGDPLGLLAAWDSVPRQDIRAIADLLQMLAPRVSAELERRQRENSLRRSEARLRLLTEHSKDVLFYYRLDPSPSFEYISPAIEEMTGHPPEAFRANPSLVVRMLEDEYRADVMRALSAGSDAPVAATIKRANGGLCRVEYRCVPLRDAGGRLVAVAGTVHDMTQWAEADENLRLSEQYRRALLEAMPDTLFRLNVDGVLLDFVSREGIRQVMGPPDSIIGRSIDELLPGPFVEPVRRLITRALRSRGPQRDEFEAPIGSESLVFEARCLPFDNGEVLLILRDFTAIKWHEAEAERQRLRDELDSKVEERIRSIPYNLTYRELAVLHLVAEGAADKQIAESLGISIYTVNKHVGNILSKMGAASRTEAGVRAIREGLLG
jgi:PAS domain S-box-containing protein